MKKLIPKIEMEAKATHFSGVISIFEGNTVIYNNAFGYKDIKNNLLNDTKTKFGIASGTKFFTALGIGKLIEQKMLSLSTTMKELDRAFTSFIDENATILNLLTHTSGIFDYYDEEKIQDFDNFFVDIPWYKLTTPSDYYPLFEHETMKFKPHARYSYSNGGFVFLGIIIEKLTGLLYRDFIEEHVLTPAGMHDSGFYALNNLPENTANGYLKDNTTTNIYNIPIRGGGDGGMYTTTDDLRSLWESVFSYQFLSQELTEKYLETYYQFKMNKTTGYGCGIYKRLDNSMFYLVGGDAGIGFDSRYMPEKKITINILSNKTDGEAQMRKAILQNLEHGS